MSAKLKSDDETLMAKLSHPGNPYQRIIIASAIISV